MNVKAKNNGACSRYQRLSAEEAEGKVPTDEELAFKTEHLAECEECRAEAAAADLVRFRSDRDGPCEPMDELNRRRKINGVLAQAAKEKSAEHLPSVPLPPPIPASERRKRSSRTSRSRRSLRTALVAAAVLAAVGVGVGVAITLLRKQSTRKSPSNRTADRPAARLLLSAGTVRHDRGQAAVGAVLKAGTTVKVQKGRAALGLPQGTEVLLSANTTVRIGRVDRSLASLYLEQGTLLATVNPRRGASRFVVETRAGQLEVKGTVFKVEVKPDRVSLKVLRGHVQVREPGTRHRSVRRGQATELAQGGRPVTELQSAEEAAILDQVRSLELIARTEAAILVISSRPAGAVVKVDGVVLGSTPLTASVRPGHRDVSVQKEGRAPVRELLALRPGERVTRDFDLAPAAPAASTEPTASTEPPPFAVAEAPGADPKAPPSRKNGRTKPSNGKSPPARPPGPPRQAGKPGQAELTATARALIRQARKRRRAKDWRGAARIYRTLIKRFPGSSEARAGRVSLGVLLLERLSNPAAALRQFNRYLASMKLGALAQEAAYGRIRALRKLGRRAKEIAALKGFLRRYPNAFQARLVKRRLKALGIKVPRDAMHSMDSM